MKKRTHVMTIILGGDNNRQMMHDVLTSVEQSLDDLTSSTPS